jgi:hypothetical protein
MRRENEPQMNVKMLQPPPPCFHCLCDSVAAVKWIALAFSINA